MRNDARPIGHDSHQSPVAGHQWPDSSPQSHVASHQSEIAREERQNEEDREPALPADDATLKTKI